MKKKRISDKWLWIGTTTVLFALFFLMNHFTPQLADDFQYTHHLQWGSSEKIASLTDFAGSVRNFYLHWGGRIYGYCFMLLTSYGPPFVFDILNSLMYLVMVFFVYRISNAGHPHNLMLWLFLHLAIWILVPDYGQVMFWQSGSVAYLWASVPVLAVLWLYREHAVSENGHLTSWYTAIPMFFLGILAGIAMENMSAGLLVIMTLSLIFFYRKKKLYSPYIACFIGALSGSLVLLLSPGNRERAETGESLSFLFKFFILDYYWVMIFGVISIAWIILFIRSYRKRKETGHWSERAVTSSLYMLGAFAAAYCLMAAPSIPERTLYIVSLYLIIAVSVIIAGWMDTHRQEVRKNLCIVCTGAMIYFLVGICDTLICSREIYIQTEQREAYILEQKSMGNKKITVPIISISYPFRSGHHALVGLSDISQDPDYWINVSLAEHYGVEQIQGYHKE